MWGLVEFVRFFRGCGFVWVLGAAWALGRVSCFTQVRAQGRCLLLFADGKSEGFFLLAFRLIPSRGQVTVLVVVVNFAGPTDQEAKTRQVR